MPGRCCKKWKEEILVCIFFRRNRSAVTGKKLTRAKLFLIEFSWNSERLSFAEVLHAVGAVPLPPYLNRSADEKDKERYQTIYALQDGSVAAPTAGLHFTGHIFSTLTAKNIQHDFVTLHVGAGTFKPVKTEIIEHHEMHAEFIDVKRTVVENIAANLGNDIVAVGTTSLRTIESLYWLGVKIILQPEITSNDLQLQQWEPYELNDAAITVEQALHALTCWMEHHGLETHYKTQVIIAPGYTLRIARALVTNFHQPNSTLLLLVAAIAGNDWRKNI